MEGLITHKIFVKISSPMESPNFLIVQSSKKRLRTDRTFIIGPFFQKKKKEKKSRNTKKNLSVPA